MTLTDEQLAEIGKHAHWADPESSEDATTCAVNVLNLITTLRAERSAHQATRSKNYQYRVALVEILALPESRLDESSTIVRDVLDDIDAARAQGEESDDE